MAGCIVAKHINDISLNDYEFLLERDGDGNSDGTIMVFENKIAALKYLTDRGVAMDDVEYMRFLEADAFLLDRKYIDL